MPGDVIIRRLPIRWQARWWAWRNKENGKIYAIRDLRRTGRLTLKRAKELIDPFFDGAPSVCPKCRRPFNG